MPWKTDEDRSHLPVELTINGRAVAARPGQTILELVREQHLDTIPTLCHEPGLPPFGSCFLCVVEVKDARGLLPSCTTRVRDGMEVVTRSDRIMRARKTALALLLSDHYADCACPGQLACPAGVDVQGYLGLAMLGHYQEALRLIRAYEPPDPPHVEVTPRAGTATWTTEAPRGTLYHRYDVDDEGSILEAKIVPPTSQKKKNMKQDLHQEVEENLNKDKETHTEQNTQTTHK